MADIVRGSRSFKGRLVTCYLLISCLIAGFKTQYYMAKLEAFRIAGEAQLSNFLNGQCDSRY